jgi:KUP system potassium uptake protein
VYGVLSLVVWALILVISVKYLIFILRADNRGEGGVLALLALILQQQRRDADRVTKQVIIVLGLIGAATESSRRLFQYSAPWKASKS